MSQPLSCPNPCHLAEQGTRLSPGTTHSTCWTTRTCNSWGPGWLWGSPFLWVKCTSPSTHVSAWSTYTNWRRWQGPEDGRAKLRSTPAPTEIALPVKTCPTPGVQAGQHARTKTRGRGHPRGWEAVGSVSVSTSLWRACGENAFLLPYPGQTRTLRFVFNLTEADRILLRWERYEPLEARDLLSFIVYYKESWVEREWCQKEDPNPTPLWDRALLCKSASNSQKIPLPESQPPRTLRFQACVLCRVQLFSNQRRWGHVRAGLPRARRLGPTVTYCLDLSHLCPPCLSFPSPSETKRTARISENPEDHFARTVWLIELQSTVLKFSADHMLLPSSGWEVPTNLAILGAFLPTFHWSLRREKSRNRPSSFPSLLLLFLPSSLPPFFLSLCLCFSLCFSFNLLVC